MAIRHDRKVSILDVMGPVMVGPSSSHTAGTARLGRVAREVLDDEPRSVRFVLHPPLAVLASLPGHAQFRSPEQQGVLRLSRILVIAGQGVRVDGGRRRGRGRIGTGRIQRKQVQEIIGLPIPVGERLHAEQALQRGQDARRAGAIHL